MRQYRRSLPCLHYTTGPYKKQQLLHFEPQSQDWAVFGCFQPSFSRNPFGFSSLQSFSRHPKDPSWYLEGIHPRNRSRGRCPSPFQVSIWTSYQHIQTQYPLIGRTSVPGKSPRDSLKAVRDPEGCPEECMRGSLRRPLDCWKLLMDKGLGWFAHPREDWDRGTILGRYRCSCIDEEPYWEGIGVPV